MQVESVPISTLVHDPNNSRIHDVKNIKAIMGSLTAFGQQKPIVVNKDNVVIAGNGTLVAAKELGWKNINVVKTDLPKREQKAFALADNKSAELAEWDDTKLEETLYELKMEDFDIGSIGFDLDDGDIHGSGMTGDDEVPDAPENIHNVERGQIWQLGNHRIMCGDSTSREDVERLMNGEKADMVFTDPPYNLGGHMDTGMYSGTSRKSHTELSETKWDNEFDIKPAVSRILEALAKDSSMYICTSHFLAGDIWAATKDVMDRIGWCVWDKNNPTPSMQKRHWTWCAELICYATKGKHTFNFPETGHAPNVWRFNKEAHTEGHPTQKPVSIPEHAILHSSNEQSLVLDLFLGSGSTLIACEKTNRKCYGMEIDPHYCSVIIERWQKYTGQVAVLTTGV